MDHQPTFVRLQKVSASYPCQQNNNNNFETDFQSLPISNFVLQYTAYWTLPCVFILKNNENNMNLNSVCKSGVRSVTTPDCNCDTNWSTCLSGRRKDYHVIVVLFSWAPGFNRRRLSQISWKVNQRSCELFNQITLLGLDVNQSCSVDMPQYVDGLNTWWSHYPKRLALFVFNKITS